MKKSDLDKLKVTFDGVFIKHHTENNPALMIGTIKALTCVALVKDKKVYVGISACDHQDQFNRKKGRLIAVGRAMHEYKLDIGIDLPRSSDFYRQSSSFPLSFTIEAPTEINTRDVVQTVVFDGLPWEIGFGDDSVVAECEDANCSNSCCCHEQHSLNNFEG